MENENQESIFDIRVNPDRFPILFRFAKLVKWIVLLSAIGQILVVVQEIKIYYYWSRAVYELRPLQALRYKIIPYFIAVHTIFVALSLVAYWQVAKAIDEGVRNNDQQRFNESFHFLNRSQSFALVVIVLGLLVEILSTAIDFMYY